MLDSQRTNLQNCAGSYLSIGITEGGIPHNAIGIPWEGTAHAYNMRLPDVYLAPEDLLNEEIMTLLLSCTVIGCYIWAPLNDYSFLNRFPQLQDLSIKNGDSIRNLDFLAELSQCRMFYLQNAKLKDLNRILTLKQTAKHAPDCMRCVCLDNCRVKDLSGFSSAQVSFSEFLVWCPKGTNEKSRWQCVRAYTRRYYEFEK